MCAVDSTLLPKMGSKFAFELFQWGEKKKKKKIWLGKDSHCPEENNILFALRSEIDFSYGKQWVMQ